MSNPTYIYIYDYYAGSYDYVSLSYVAEYGYSYGYDDEGDTIYYGSSYLSPTYVYDFGEYTYFASYSSTAYDGMVFYDYSSSATLPSYIYIYDYYGGTYDHVSLYNTGSGFAYGYDDLGQVIYYGSTYSSPNYVYDAGEYTYFASYSSTGYDGMVFYDYSSNAALPSYIYIYDNYSGTYDHVSLYNTGSGYAYGYDDQGQVIYYGSSYSSPNYVYDAGEYTYFASYSSTGYDGMVFYDYSLNNPSYIYIYDYYGGTYDYVSLYNTGSGFAYGYDDQDQVIYYGSSYSSPNYVYDAGEYTYFASYSSTGYDGMVFYDYSSSATAPSYIYIYDYYGGTYDYVSLYNTGSGYAYGYDDQGQVIYYGSSYSSPNYVYDAGEYTYFASYSSTGYDGMVFYDYSSSATLPSYIYIYDYYGDTYDYVSLYNTGSGYAYGYDDQGQVIYYGSTYSSPTYIYDAGENTYFSSGTSSAYDGKVFYDYSSSATAPSYIYIYDYYGGTYDYVSLYNTGSGYAYGYDDQGQVIYYGSTYSSPNYVYDAGENTYFASYSSTAYGGMVFYDYSFNVTLPSYIYIYDYYGGTYDYVSLYNTGSGYAYGYDDQGQVIYYGSAYYSPNYVYDAGENTYFASYSSTAYDGMLFYDYSSSATLPSYIYIYDYYGGTYDYVSLYNTGSGFAYGYDDQGQVIYYGSTYSSPTYIYDAGENTYFSSGTSSAYDGKVFYDHTTEITLPSYIYIYDYYSGTYDYVSLTKAGHGIAYGYDGQGQMIYYGGTYSSPTYVYDSGENTYFASDSSTAYDGMVFYDYSPNVAVPSYIYIYDYYAGTYDYVSLTNTGYGNAYGYDDQGQVIYYGSSYSSPSYVYDAGEDTYFASNSSTAYDGMVFYDYSSNIPSYIYICDYYLGIYDYVSLTNTGSGYAYGYDDQGQVIYYGGSVYSPNYIYDAGESTYFSSYSSTAYDGMVFYDYSPNVTLPSYIYIYDYYGGTYDYVSLYNTGYGYAYGYDDQGQVIYYGGSYGSPNYVYDAGESTYFSSYSSTGYDGMVFYDYSSNTPSYIYIYDYSNLVYDTVSLINTGYGYAYGYDDDGQVIYYGGSYGSPSYVYDSGEGTYFYAYDGGGFDGSVYYDYTSSMVASYIYYYQFAYSSGDMFWGYWYDTYGQWATGESIAVYDEDGGYAVGTVTSITYAGMSNAIGDDYIYSYYDAETNIYYTPYYYSQGLVSTAADIGTTVAASYDYVYINGGWDAFGWDSTYQVMREAN